MIKLFHFLFLFLWVGTLFLMPYLLRQKFQPAYKLYLKFQLPVMILALILGGFLLSTNPEKMRSGWFHMKLTGVIGLIGCDIWSGLLARQFSRYGLQKRQWVYFLLQGLILFFIFVILAGILLGKKG